MPFLGIPWAAFSNKHTLDKGDKQAVLLQLSLALIVAGDIGNIGYSDTHSNNILIETLPTGLTMRHIYQLRLPKGYVIFININIY